MRESGYYWVRFGNEWDNIAYYDCQSVDWEFEGRTVWEGYFDEIDERKIERQ